jgi:hypothetical protein
VLQAEKKDISLERRIRQKMVMQNLAVIIIYIKGEPFFIRI